MSASFDQVHDAGVAQIAPLLGLTSTDTAGRLWAPCPACGAESRGSRDPRGPIGTTADGLFWHCHRCSAHGDAVRLAAIARLGKTEPDKSEWRELGRWFSSKTTSDANPARRSASAPASPLRPPAAELAALWNASRPVSDDAEVVAWLRSRAISLERVARADLARALPANATRLPSWAHLGQDASRSPWTQRGYRLIQPVFGATGRMESVRARRVRVSGTASPKEVSPRDLEVRSSVFANKIARAMLAGETFADGVVAADLVRERHLVIVEGAPDFLTACEVYRGRAVIGIFSGAWDRAIADRVPDGVEVWILQHADGAGEAYSERIRQTLNGRARIFRRVFPKGQDLNDLQRALCEATR